MYQTSVSLNKDTQILYKKTDEFFIYQEEDTSKF